MSNKRIAVLGLAFNKDTDGRFDMGHKPAEQGARVVGYDPMAIPNTKKQLGDLIEYSDSAHSALKGADCAVIAGFGLIPG